ncbi:hypothetical protein GLE_5239 [Lysobacter enzymogenes]|uniref:Uncharacterized protein n=1 Tax=Lysobacter enzymogenes TaxID=69 RepID=A0A0S2DPS0_LYSEN|nr:hypothetical protein [Lysobacter enzymogenes]ALN60580.1 hypothetical protein GLE_5239 [Lysobacter enzymogenes]QCW28480.1 hypothetical protein FE772_25355 [Lysobacter enzymogenes]
MRIRAVLFLRAAMLQRKRRARRPHHRNCDETFAVTAMTRSRLAPLLQGLRPLAMQSIAVIPAKANRSDAAPPPHPEAAKPQTRHSGESRNPF